MAFSFLIREICNLYYEKGGINYDTIRNCVDCGRSNRNYNGQT